MPEVKEKKSIAYGERGMKNQMANKTGVQSPSSENLPKPIQGVGPAQYLAGKPLSDNVTFKKFR